MSKPVTPWAEFVAYDLFGHEYNCKYPPNKDLYGLDFEGYATPNQLTFFYDFCINCRVFVSRHPEIIFS